MHVQKILSAREFPSNLLGYRVSCRSYSLQERISVLVFPFENTIELRKSFEGGPQISFQIGTYVVRLALLHFPNRPRLRRSNTIFEEKNWKSREWKEKEERRNFGGYFGRKLVAIRSEATLRGSATWIPAFKAGVRNQLLLLHSHYLLISTSHPVHFYPPSLSSPAPC